MRNSDRMVPSRTPCQGVCAVLVPEFTRRGAQCELDRQGDAVAERQPQCLQMILQRQGLEQVAVDIDIAAEVGFGESQWIAAEQQRADRRLLAYPQREGRLATFTRRAAERAAAAVGQAHRHRAAIGGKEFLQRSGPLADLAAVRTGPRSFAVVQRSRYRLGRNIHVHVDPFSLCG